MTSPNTEANIAQTAAPIELDGDDVEYAIVEIMGHRRHAGRVLEVERFGAKFLRIDIPTEGDFAKGFTSHFYGGASIFSITPTDLSTVCRMTRPHSSPGRYLPAYDEDGIDIGANADDENW